MYSRIAPLLALAVALPAAAQPTVDELKKQAGKDASAKTAGVAAPEGKAIEFKLPPTPIAGCTADQQSGMEKAILAAREKVDTCLSGINPKMASEIAKQYSKFKFSCYQESRGAGGDTQHETDGKGHLTAANISITMHSRLIQYSREARVFHEMIHAIDLPADNQAAKTNRDGHFIISAARHAKAGFPDPVYGCQFSCYPSDVGEDEGKVMNSYSRLLKESNMEIPDSTKNIPGEDATPYSKLYLKKYAYLCETGKPIVPKDLVDKDRAANRPTCVAEGLLNACDAADDKSCASKNPPKGQLCALRCETTLDIAANGGHLSGKQADKMFSLGKRLSDASDNGGADLSDEDKAVYADAQKKGLIKACR